MRIPVLALCSILIFIGCSKEDGSEKVLTKSATVQFPTSLQGLIRFNYEQEATPKFYELNVYDRYSFFKQYSGEILRTLQIKDSLIADNIAVGLYSYSIGPVSYNGKLWFRKVDGTWRICISQYFSTYGDDPFQDGMPERAKGIIKKVENWTKANKNVWWEY